MSLVQAVLQFEVKLGTALNKIPSPASCVDLWRGAWMPAEKLDEMREAEGKMVSFPWFQSTTTDHMHSYTFMHPMNEPQHCKPECIEKKLAYPIHLQYRSRYGKNVTEWNEREKEWILMPNLELKVESVSKILNDPFREMSNSELVAWFLDTHPFRSWQKKEEESFGPFPKLAKVLRERQMNGTTFADLPHGEKYTLLGLEGTNYGHLFAALNSRFELPPRAGGYGILVANDVPFYYKVTLEDLSCGQ